MNYLLKISAIDSDEEWTHALFGHIEDVYWYARTKCTIGEVIDIYEEEEYIETVIRLNSSVAKLTHKLEW
ncbi:hypothetical protein PL757_20525 [Phocaeicola vulgatus]|uniref:hypothetical protein n=1 Tax=Phocaeicola vulgatus TaxID=821 RepID=UPI00189D517B|nr:hypothetical protein [Phocaeicola vulgatus]MDB1077505.1 hypothetical protein [Phocaeicola vulgatus]